MVTLEEIDKADYILYEMKRQFLLEHDWSESHIFQLDAKWRWQKTFDGGLAFLLNMEDALNMERRIVDGSYSLLTAPTKDKLDERDRSP